MVETKHNPRRIRATPEPLAERVIKQLAKKFHYFDVIAKIDSKSLSIHYEKEYLAWNPCDKELRWKRKLRW